jgi:O-antigen ligase
MVIALVLSQTRAWILGSIVACVFLLSYKVFKKLRLINKVIFITCLILFLAIFSNQVRNISSFLFVRESSPTIYNIISSNVYDTSLMMRLHRWQIGWSLFLKNPLTGVGIGNAVRFRGTEWVSDINAANVGYIDNHYMGVLTETGMIGSIGWIILIGAIFKSIRHISRNIANSEQRTFLVGISGGLIVLFIGGFFWNLTSAILDSSRLFLLIALLFSMEKIVTTKEN